MSRPEHVADRVDDLVHGLLSAEDAVLVERHCADCADCRAALDAARRRLAALRSVPATEAPPDIAGRTVKKIDAHGRRWKRLRNYVAGGAFATAAGVALLLLGLHLYLQNLSPSPYDLRLLGQTRLQPGTPASLRVRLTDRTKGSALVGVPVEVALRDRQSRQSTILCSFVTDAEGTGEPRFNVPDWEGDFDLVVSAKPGWSTETLQQGVRLQRDWNLMLTSDKPVYQPGQEIHLRSLTLGKLDLKPAADRDAVFTVSDPKGNVIFKKGPKNSAFGIAWADCALDPEVAEGTYTAQCTVGNTVSKLSVEVKKYVLPKFKVDVTLDQPFYLPGQKVRGKVKADYFFGKSVSGGNVVIEAAALDVGLNKLAELKRTTDADGATEFEVDLPAKMFGRPQDDGKAQLAVRVSVTDSAGQKESRAVSRPVTDQPIRIEVIPEMGSLVRGVANTVFVLTTYADGKPAKARVVFPGIQQPPVQTNALGVAHVWLQDVGGPIDWRLSATDEKGLSGTRQVHLPVGQAAEDFVLRTDKAVYTAGETVQMLALGGGKEPIFFDLIKDGQTLLTETIRMNTGLSEVKFPPGVDPDKAAFSSQAIETNGPLTPAGVYQLDLPAELSGTMQLCAYRFGADGLPVRKTRVLVVKPSQQLDVRVTSEKKEYRPREQAKLDLQLTDRHGRPTPGALSVSAVDEAVFSVLEQRPGLEKTFYALEQELLRPVYAIYPWSPDLENAAAPEDRRELERALFAATTQTASAPEGPAWKSTKMAAQEREERALASALEPSGASPHSLNASTFTAKAREVEQTKEKGLELVRVGWFLLFGTLMVVGGLAAYIALWVYGHKALIIGMHVLGGGLLLLLLAVIAFHASLVVEDRATFDFVGGAVGAKGAAADRSPASGEWRQQAEFANPNIGLNPEIPLHSHFGEEASVPGPKIRVRDWFPETTLWKPQLITDDQGRVSLPVDLADSITAWRVTVSGVTADGRLGSTTETLKVFQPFFVDMNLPVALTRNDEVEVPLVVYNYSDQKQTVDLTLEDAPWFDRLDAAARTVEVGPREVKSLSYRLKVTKVGHQTLTVKARAGDVADAVKREIEVLSDGRRVEEVSNGTLTQPVTLPVTVPADAIEGSQKAILKLYPSNFSQLVEGLENIFRMPSGCFEQTSSATYPNVLALDYLKRTGKASPAVEAKARQYVHLGYQRLLGFEISGGGFDWFGNPPANRTLTAYGLMEFVDMARVHDVDPELIRRTRIWLMGKRNPDGSWDAEAHMMHDDPTRRGEKDDGRLTTTAYIAWAVFEGQQSYDVGRTRDYLVAHRADTITDPYTLALIGNGLVAMGAEAEALPYLERLDSLKSQEEDGKLVFWKQAGAERTMFYGAGRSGDVETTALAALALLKAKQSPGTTGRALAWLVKQKDANGTWYSTQATVLALKALLLGTETARQSEPERRVVISWQGGQREVVISPDQSEVMQMINLSDVLKSGENKLTVREANNAAIGYQLSFRYHVPGAPGKKDEPLTIDISYDRDTLKVDDTLTATATVVNKMSQVAPMVMLDLPIPGGFAIAAEDLQELVAKNQIAKFQVNPRSAIVYLRGLEPGKPLTLKYRLRATMPVKVTAPAGWVYEYYDTDKKGASKTATLTVEARR